MHRVVMIVLVLLVALAGATIVLLTLGTFVLTTFDPCIGEPSATLAPLCAAQ